MEIAVSTAAFAPLLLLACPVGMGLMMLFMSKGMKGDNKGEDQADADEVQRLRAEQKRLAADVERMQSERPTERSEEREPAAS